MEKTSKSTNTWNWIFYYIFKSSLTTITIYPSVWNWDRLTRTVFISFEVPAQIWKTYATVLHSTALSFLEFFQLFWHFHDFLLGSQIFCQVTIRARARPTWVGILESAKMAVEAVSNSNIWFAPALTPTMQYAYC